ncbi:MAG: hypothetical protein LBF50_06680 [Azoarcus sp.]|jgi:hypothetical protein|nr:hypothetical protein [Azoarcus sp.]
MSRRHKSPIVVCARRGGEGALTRRFFLGADVQPAVWPKNGPACGAWVAYWVWGAQTAYGLVIHRSLDPETAPLGFFAVSDPITGRRVAEGLYPGHAGAVAALVQTVRAMGGDFKEHLNRARAERLAREAFDAATALLKLDAEQMSSDMRLARHGLRLFVTRFGRLFDKDKRDEHEHI